MVQMMASTGLSAGARHPMCASLKKGRNLGMCRYPGFVASLDGCHGSASILGGMGSSVNGWEWVHLVRACIDIRLGNIGPVET
jgi:hypothetical protein